MIFFKKKKDGESIKYRMTPKMVKPVYDAEGILQFAGCLPIDTVNKRFLLVTSASHPDAWVMPKGSVDLDENEKQAAMRETWEEAGVKGTIQRHIGVFAEKAKEGVRAHHSIYEMEIKQVAKKFPEQSIRERRWFSYEDAMAAVKAHYVKDAISMSSLSPLVHPDEDGEKKKKKKKKEEDEPAEDEKGKKKEEEGEKGKKKKKEEEGKKKKKEEEGKKKKKEEEGKKKREEEPTEDEPTEDEKGKKKKKKKEGEKKNPDVLGEQVLVDEGKNTIIELTDEEIIRLQMERLEAHPHLIQPSS